MEAETSDDHADHYIRAQGTVYKNIKNWIQKLGVPCPIELLQKAVLLGTAKPDHQEGVGYLKLRELACYSTWSQ